MTDKEFFIQTVTDEAPRFERVFKAMPEDKFDYTPHPKSKTARALANTISGEAGTFSEFLTTGVVNIKAPPGGWPVFGSVAEIVAAMNKGLADAKTTATGMSDAEWQLEAKMMFGEKEVWKTTRGNMALSLILDLIHHRGQLSTYIRPMGGKVPSIYGPSGDAEE